MHYRNQFGKEILYINLGELKTQLILHQFKPDKNTGGSFVDFMIVVDPEYIMKALKVASNNLGKNQRNSGIDFVSAVIQGKRKEYTAE